MNSIPFDKDKDRFYSFDIYLKNRFKKKITRVPVNLGFGCPNRDGYLSSDGCIFCNENSFLQDQCLSATEIDKQIKMGISKNKGRSDSYMIYFQSGTSTYTKAENLLKIYEKVKDYKQVKSVSFSTRSDFINNEIADAISQFSKSFVVIVELGLQSSHDSSLKFLNRNHTYEDFVKATKILKNYKIDVHAHVIIGIPGEDKEMVTQTARRISEEGINGVKIHNLEVIKNTKLEEMWNSRLISLLSFNEYIEYLIGFLENLSSGITVTRLISSSPASLRVAPNWNISSGEFKSIVQNELKVRKSYQGINSLLSLSLLLLR